MDKDTEVTLVIFRKYKSDGSIIAYFPELAYDVAGYMGMAYQHIGQHSGADYQALLKSCVPASETEYHDLKEELESLGYNLKVIKRERYNHFQTRKNTKWE